MKCDKGCSDLVIEGGDGINSVCPRSGSEIDFKGGYFVVNLPFSDQID